MLLSQVVVKGLDGELISDGEFETLNYCTYRSDKAFLTFMENPKFLNSLYDNNQISCVLCTKELTNMIPERIKGVFVTDEPKAVFHQIHNNLANNEEYRLPTFKTKIGKNCKISPLAYIAPNNVVIGDNVIIEEFVSIKEHTSIGNNCIINAGTVIGGKSFSFARSGKDDALGLVDLGQVKIEDNVEICCNCHIARGTLPTDITFIGSNTKLDAMVHIGHGTKIGSRVFITAGAQIAGNVVIGDAVWIGVNATISNRIFIDDNARITLGSVVTKNVESGETVTGNFAIKHNKFLSNLKKSL